MKEFVWMMVGDNRTVSRRNASIRLDLNRKHTEAEVELVRYCFGCSDEEARKILSVRLTKAHLAEVHGMLDAMRIERMEAEGHIFPVPEWLKRMRKMNKQDTLSNLGSSK